MSLLRTIQLSHLPPSLAIHVALYQDLKNASFLREQLLSGNAEFEYAFIDASLILSTTHALAAAFRAVNDYVNKRLRSKNVHSEIVFSLSPSNNITDSFRKFGLTDGTTSLLVMKVSTSPEITHDSVAQHLEKVIEGTPVPFTNESLMSISDLGKIQKAYKLGSLVNTSTTNDSAAEREEDNQRRLENCIVGAIALRAAT
ncbi:hypothetical protein VTO42DRAFT_4523 [Malbranchea cinnamomea]